MDMDDDIFMDWSVPADQLLAQSTSPADASAPLLLADCDGLALSDIDVDANPEEFDWLFSADQVLVPLVSADLRTSPDPPAAQPAYDIDAQMASTSSVSPTESDPPTRSRRTTTSGHRRSRQAPRKSRVLVCCDVCNHREVPAISPDVIVWRHHPSRALESGLS